MPMPRIRPSHAAAAFMGLVLFVSPACESSFNDDGHISLEELEGRPSSTDTTATSASSSSPSSHDSASSGNSNSSGTWTLNNTNNPAAISEIIDIKWLDKDISNWPITTTLHASVSGGNINMKYDKAKVWRSVDGLVGNCWAIVNIGGTWYAGTFEYLRPGQTSKPTGVLDGSLGNHFTKKPLSSWRPKSGERFGLMVSGLCRSSARNVSERSNIVVVTWP